MPKLGQVLILLLVILSAVGLVVVGLSLGIGYALAWLLPDVSVGMGLIAGAVIAIGMLDLTVRLLGAVHREDLARSEQERTSTEEYDDPMMIVPAAWRSRRGKRRRRQ